MAYSVIFRSIDIVSGTLFKYDARAIYAYSGFYLGRFSHIQNFVLFRYLMPHAYSGIFTKLHSQLNLSTNICPHSAIFQQIQGYSVTLHCRSKQCKPTPALHVRFFFQVTIQIYLEHFFIFASRVDIQYFALLDNVFNNNNNNKNNIPPMLARHSCHPRQHAIYTNTPSTLPTIPTIQTLALHPHWHINYAIQVNHASTLSAQLHHPYQYTTHAIHASTSSTPFLKLVEKFP